jgi:hypothetical protein
MIGIIILILLAAILVAVFVVRVYEIRRGGTPAVVRKLPAQRDQGWHHGVLRYRDEAVAFYRLSSLMPGSNRTFSRQGVDVIARRRPDRAELDLMDDATIIVELHDGPEAYEVALDRSGLTAFLSWLESRPSGRSQRRRPRS